MLSLSYSANTKCPLCKISLNLEPFQFLGPNWTKNDTYQTFIKKFCHFRNQRMPIAHCANFHQIWSIFNFWDQIGPKMTPVRFLPKNIVTIVISVFQLPIVPIFIKFRPIFIKFGQF